MFAGVWTAQGSFSMEGCIELAWLCGMVRSHNGPLKTNPGVVRTRPAAAIPMENPYCTL